ncbi:RxLR effector protein [Phytophthora megakarya]|uniref:RxLR effector protein n=1 Tax=Phytophthora megakarya TaxID=4795 RepID=A0A225VBI1_9STRA|nr:RxLR effector protein [Phytophthora megakarya]
MNPSPALLFKTVGLGKESVKLDNNNPTFIRWLQYVKKYRATKDDEFAFVDNQLIKLLNGKLSESELVTLSVSLTKVSGLEDLSSSLIRSLAWMESRHKLFNEAWLKAKESPDKVFKILELEGRVQARDPMFREWLRYSDMYMKETGRSFPVANFLAKPETDHRIAVIFQSLKEVDDLKALAETQQTNLFKNWIKEFTYTPRTLQRTLSAPLIRGGPMFATLEAYTLQFAKHKGSKVLEEVKTLFAADDFMGALLAAEKL